MGTPYEQQDFASPTETREFPNGRLDLLHIGGADIGRLTLQPGWRWSNDVKPVAGTELCEAPHFQYHVSGTLRIQTADGDDRRAAEQPQRHDGITSTGDHRWSAARTEFWHPTGRPRHRHAGGYGASRTPGGPC
jgi:hypothetical protein